MSELQRQIANYRLDTDDLVLHLRGEAREFDPIIEDLMKADSTESEKYWAIVWRKKAELATRRLEQLEKLDPPEELKHIHESLQLAFEHGLKGRREEARGNSKVAWQAFQDSADELGRNADLWEAYGFSALATFEDMVPT